MKLLSAALGKSFIRTMTYWPRLWYQKGANVVLKDAPY